MKYSNDEILDKAMKILEKEQFEYDEAKDLKVSIVDTSLQSYLDFEKPTWRVVIEFGGEIYGQNRSAFLYIDDETGKPIYLQHSTGKIDFD